MSVHRVHEARVDDFEHDQAGNLCREKERIDVLRNLSEGARVIQLTIRSIAEEDLQAVREVLASGHLL